MRVRIALLTLRAVAALVATWFVLEQARGLVVARLSISPHLYSTIAYAILLTVLWLAGRSPLRVLAARGYPTQEPWLATQRAVGHGELSTVHRYGWPLRLLILFAAVLFAALPWLSKGNATAIAVSTYLACFTAVLVLVVIFLHLVTYSVTINAGGISIRSAIGLRQIAAAEVRAIDLIRTRNGPQLVLSLNNGEIIRFGRLLTNFPDLRESLAALSGIAGSASRDRSS